MKRYIGGRDDKGALVLVTDDERRGGPKPLAPRNDVRNHSPSGFEWGYGGSGPAQLALALCLDALDDDVPRAIAVYQKYKWAVVVRIPQAANEWMLTQSEVLESILDLERRAREEDERRANAPLAEQAPPF